MHSDQAAHDLTAREAAEPPAEHPPGDRRPDEVAEAERRAERGHPVDGGQRGRDEQARHRADDHGHHADEGR